ncbi:pentapeptide repeat-containing protein [Streptomyces sp. NPDC050095]|uniref:pentapeptide repeat-containing protein n=1 Tax=unclassified Streptomyces TaxID=2593676 RepID=UPI0034458E0E
MQRLSKKVTAVGAVAATCVVLFLFILLLWRGPWWFDGSHINNKNLQPADGVVITGFRTALIALGAGVVAAAGLYYTHRTLQHTRERDREQAELTREGQMTDRYVEAIKLLGSASLTERLGGIYALERILRDSVKDHFTVVEVLAAFVRTNAAAGNPAPPEPVAEDVRAALEVLRRRPEDRRGGPLQLSNVCLPKASLDHAFLHSAVMRGAQLQAADLQSCDATYSFLSDAGLDGAFLYNATLYGADLKNSRLNGAQLLSANLDKAQLLGACLDAANLHKVRAREADLNDASLRDASLQGSDWSNSSFLGADLSGATLTNARFRQASFVGVKFGTAVLAGADIAYANLDGADLSAAAGLTVDQLLTAKVYGSTRLPGAFEENPNIAQHVRACEKEIFAGPFLE